MRISLLLLTILALPALGEGVWKWKDENGVVHYSDQPGPGAVRIDLHSQTFSAPDKPSPSTNAPSRSRLDANNEQFYRSLEIWKPATGETIPNSGGQVEVRISLEPSLQPTDTLALYLDGKRIEEADNSLDFTLADVPRGEHSLTATVTDGNTGRVAIQSPSVTFFVQQASVAQPPAGPALRPRPQPHG